LTSSYWERWREEYSIKNKDISEKNFIALNDVFADIFNVFVFHGRQIVTPESLEDIAGISQYKADDAKLHEQERDTCKLWKGQGVNLVIMGVENQTKPERDMPFRCIGYDGASYRSQLLKHEEKLVKGRQKKVCSKERYPVITIVLYFGEKPWKYPLELKNSFHPKLPQNEITKELEFYITDYFVNAYNNPNYEPDPAVITHVDEFLKLMQVLTGDNRYETIMFTEQEKKEGIGMCKVLDAREKRGEKRGKKVGATQLHELFRVLTEKGYQLEEILEMTAEDAAREKLYKEYGIA